MQSHIGNIEIICNDNEFTAKTANGKIEVFLTENGAMVTVTTDQDRNSFVLLRKGRKRNCKGCGELYNIENMDEFDYCFDCA